MFERVLFDTLLQGLKDLQIERRALEAFVAGLPLDSDEEEQQRVVDLLLAFTEQEKPIIHGYARSDTTFPVWSIVLAAEQESMRSLGDENADTDEHGSPEKSSVFDSNHQVLIYAKHPDVCLYLYELAKALIIGRRQWFLASGVVDDVSTIAGTELSPDQMYLPEFLFVRSLQIGSKAEVRGIGLGAPETGEAHPLAARRVTGVHVRDQRIMPDGVRHRLDTED